MAVVDAYIEWTGDPQVDRAFEGDEHYSPLRLALLALLGAAELRHIYLRTSGEGYNPPPAVRALIDNERRLRVLGPSQKADIPARPIGRALRQWNHTGSLYGVLMSSEYCRFGNLGAVAEAIEASPPNYVLVLSSSFGFLCGDTVLNLIDHARTAGWRETFYTSDGPPGMIPILWEQSMLEVLHKENSMAQSGFAQVGRFWGRMIGYAPSEVVECRRSFDLRTPRSRAFCRTVAQHLLQQRGTPHFETPCSALEVVRAGIACHDAWVGDTPRDIEIEITTARSIEPRYLPKLSRPPARMSIAQFRDIVQQFDPKAGTLNLTLGGHGDPLEHPDLIRMLEIARPCVGGLNVRTFGLGLRPELFQEFRRCAVDVVNVRFGYWGRELYRDLNGVDEFDRLATLLLDIRKEQIQKHNETFPLVVPEVVKGLPGDKTLLQFYETWQAVLAWPMVTSYNTWGGAVEPQQAIDLYPGKRKPCLKISEQMTIFADGRVPVCAQDFDATQVVGDAFATPLIKIWRSERMTAIRDAHQAADYARCFSRCQGCNEWFRFS